jgi:hypothetical protein
MPPSRTNQGDNVEAKSNVPPASTHSKQRPSSAERRAAQLASVATRQADLKREAAERQVQRDLKAKAAAGSARPSARTRRSV